MSKFQMIHAFAQRAAGAAAPALRSLWARSSAAPVNTKIGAYAAIAAVIVGAGMLAANIERQRHAAAVTAASLPAAAAMVAPVIAEPLAPAQPPAPVAAAAPAPPAVAEAAPKATARVDMTPTGSVAKEATAKPHKHPHRKKPKDVDATQ